MSARLGLAAALRQPLRRLAPDGIYDRLRAVAGAAPAAPQAHPPFNADMRQESAYLGMDGHHKMPYLHGEGLTGLGDCAQGCSSSNFWEDEVKLATPGVGGREDRAVETAVTERLKVRHVSPRLGSSAFLTHLLVTRARH
jgi:hypothetical protein